jgi:hypothetical protein
MDSGKLIIVAIPSIIALIFSIFVTKGIIGDIPTRFSRAKQLLQKYNGSPITVLTQPPPKSQLLLR